MDIYRLSTDIKLINQIGVTLSPEEKMKLELQLAKIQEIEAFDQVLFWGRVQGVKFDYYIGIGLNFKGKFEFPIKKFFWARSDNFEFSLLPEVNLEYRVQVDNFRNLFIGDPKIALIPVPEDQQGEEPPVVDPVEGEEKPNESDEEENVKVKPKAFTELDRLAYVVRAIENDCSLVPVGAFKLTPTHELRYNDSFRGVPASQIANQTSFQHFRAPQSEEKRAYIARDDALFKFDFLDPITIDLPKGCWSLQVDSSKLNATVRSISWPGFIAYHKANTQIFGYSYFGNGIKNSDLPFLF